MVYVVALTNQLGEPESITAEDQLGRTETTWTWLWASRTNQLGDPRELLLDHFRRDNSQPFKFSSGIREHEP